MSKKPRPKPVPAEFIPHLVDAHTHLASCGARQRADVEALMERAQAAGVDWVCTVGDGVDEAELALQAAKIHPDVYAACAVHPTRVGELEDEQQVARLRALIEDERCVAVGETGLDYYWVGKMEGCASPQDQQRWLRWHAQVAREVGKTLMIHNREADEDLMRILGEFDDLQVQLHCFSSPLDVAREALDRGYVLSFSGNVTFKANEELREAARLAPVGQIVVETDAPYMTPEPYRGGRNESAFIGHTAKVLAQVRGESVEEFAVHTQATAAKLFGLVK